MDNSLKFGVYNKIIKALRNNPNVSNLQKKGPDESGEVVKCEFTCDLCKEIAVEFTMFVDGDFVSLKGRTPEINKEDGTVLNEIASEITEGTTTIYTVYDGAISFQLAIPLVTLEGVEGQKQIFNSTLDFVHMLCRNKDRLGCNDSVDAHAVDFTNEAEDDPYGFNNFDDTEDDGTTKPIETDDFEDVEVDFLDEPTEEQPENDEMDIFTNDEQPEESITVTEDVTEDIFEIETSQEEQKEADDDIDFNQKLKEIQEKREKRQAERNARRNKDAEQKPVLNVEKEVEETEEKEEDIFGNPESEQKYETDESVTAPISKPIAVAASPRMSTPEPVEGFAPVNYERAPEVVEQMKHLYAEVDQLFAQRKKQADYRENTLNEFSDKLDRREKELNLRSERLDQNYKERQMEFERQTVDLETQKREIDFQWQKIDMERGMIETQRKDLDESRALLAKSRALDEEKTDIDARVSVLNTELKEKEMEIGVLKENLATLVRENDEKIQALTKEMSELQKMADDSSEIDSLKAQIISLEEENESLNNDIDDLNAAAEKLMKDLNDKERTIQSLKSKNTESAGNETAWKKKESSWAKKEAEYKKLLKEADNSEELDKIQDDLDEANMKIKQLESELSKKPAGNKDDTKRIAELEKELAQMTSELKKADAAYEQEKKAKEKLQNSSATSKDSSITANEIKNNLAEIGVQVEPVATNGELILAGHCSDNMQVVVNVDAGILYVDKGVKRGVKFRQQFEKWNMEDIRISYLFYDNKVVCKCVYDDVSKAALDIIGKFSTLS